MRYTVLIDGEAGGFGVVFPDLPGCTAMGETVDDALLNAGESLRDWTLGVEARGGRVPPPRSPDQLRGDDEVATALASGSALASVALVRETGRVVRTSLALDAGVLSAVDAAAHRLGLTRSATMELLATRGLPTLV